MDIGKTYIYKFDIRGTHVKIILTVTATYYEFERSNERREYMNRISAKNLFNAKVSSIPVKDVLDEELEVAEIGFYHDIVKRPNDPDGEDCELAVIVTVDGRVVASPSPTFVDAVKNLEEYAESAALDTVTIKIVGRPSRNGNPYYTVILM